MSKAARTRAVIILLAAGGGALLVFPWFGGEYYVDLVVRLMIFAMFAMSLDLLIGFTGLISFGHAAFFGLAGYILAVLSPETGPAPLWIVLPACLAGTALAALIIGVLSVRTSGVYFIMITLAFAQMLYYFCVESSILGGSDGLFVQFRPALSWGGKTLLDVDRPAVFYYLVLASLVGVYGLLATIVRAPFGRVLRGIRINEGRVRALGYPTRRYKLTSFVIAGTLAGFAGFLQAAHTGYVSPGLLGWHQSGLVMMVVILGGMGTLYGPILGAFAFGLAQNWFQDVSTHPALLTGLLVIMVVVALPRGLAGLLASSGQRGAARPRTGGDDEGR